MGDKKALFAGRRRKINPVFGRREVRLGLLVLGKARRGKSVPLPISSGQLAGALGELEPFPGQEKKQRERKEILPASRAEPRRGSETRE